MNAKKTNCCDTENANCNSDNTNCCSSEKTTKGNHKKKIGLGILILAFTFAAATAFTTPDASNKKASCTTGETSCTTSCDTATTNTTATSSCCSKK